MRVRKSVTISDKSKRTSVVTWNCARASDNIVPKSWNGSSEIGSKCMHSGIMNRRRRRRRGRPRERHNNDL